MKEEIEHSVLIYQLQTMETCYVSCKKNTKIKLLEKLNKVH